jgi:hypothetical protein
MAAGATPLGGRGPCHISGLVGITPGSARASSVVSTSPGGPGHKGMDVQTTRPRDLGALLFVIALFAILLATSIVLGSAPHLR